MLIQKKELNKKIPILFSNYFTCNNTILFDIETTGLSANTSFLYLIGCIYFEEDKPHLIQWLSESISEEKIILTKFFTFLKNYHTIIHYNGTGFDLPYLEQKRTQFSLPDAFSGKVQVDFFKLIQPYKQRLKLQSLKQKHIEKYLNFQREDIFSGGDLIELYKQFIGMRKIELLRNKTETYSNETTALYSVLLLHNTEDLEGLLHISAILALKTLFDGKIAAVESEEKENELLLHTELKEELPVTLELPIEIIKNSSCNIRLYAAGKKAIFHIPYFIGELKYFFENYKEYYYLPVEDFAIHESVAEFVDKKYRVRAKANNCYTKKVSRFLPQKSCCILPCFKNSKNDKVLYFEATNDFLSDKMQLLAYAVNLLT